MSEFQPLTNFRFIVKIENKDVAAFTEITFPDSSIDIIEYRTGDSKELALKKIPGLVKYSNVVLKRGFSKDDTELFDWFMDTRKGNVVKKSIQIQLMSLSDITQPLRSIMLSDCFPVKYNVSGLNGNGNEIMIDTLELAIDKIEIG